MPKTKVNTPDGGTVTVEHPEGASQEDILAFAQQQYEAEQSPQEPAPYPTLYGGLPALREGGKILADLGIAGARNLAARFAGGVTAAPFMPLSAREMPGGGTEKLSESVFNAVQEKLGGGPLTESGTRFMEGLAPIAQTVDTALTDAFDVVPGGPAEKAAVKALTLAPLEILSYRGLGGGLREVPNAGRIVPEVSDLFGAGRVAFNEARLSGGGIRPQALTRAAEKIRTLRNDVGLRVEFDADLHPKAFALRNRLLRDLESGNVDFDELMTLRELAGDVAGALDKSEARLGMILKSEIDNFVDSLGPDDVFAGDPVRAAQSLKSARQFWRDASAARTIEREIELAGERAGQFSGSGFENALRTQFRQLSMRITRGREKGFLPEEIELIKRVAKGDPVGNVFRYLGKSAPTSIVSGSLAFGVPAMLGSPLLGAGVLGIGALGRKLATQATVANAQKALEAPLTRSLLEP